MGKKGSLLLIGLLSLVMLVTICWAITMQQQEISHLRFQVDGVQLNLYQDPGTSVCSLVLPAFSHQASLTASHGGMGSLSFSDGSQVYSALSQVPLEQDVVMTVSFPWGAENQYPLRLMQCSIGQTIYLETLTGTMEMVNREQGTEASVSVTVWDKNGQLEYQGHADISGRGNGTWEWDKKPYDLNFPETVTVGGFENVNKLCLLAEYVDESKLRNALAYHTGQLLDIPYASGYEFADVYIDGVYQGIYGLTTKREYTKHIAEDGIQSVFELSSSYKGDFFYTDYATQIRIHQGTQEQILSYVEEFEYALMDRNWDRLWQIMDLESWARKYAMDEFFYNYDLPLTSQYYYVDGDGMIKCMLPWDYEWIFYPRISPYDFNREYALAAYYHLDNWYSVLLESEQFRLAVEKVLEEEFTPQLFDAMGRYMNGCIQTLSGSWHCDLYRWSSAYAAAPGTDGGKGLMETYAGRFREHFVTRRGFLLDVLENWEDYRLVLFYTEENGNRYQSNLQIMVPKGTPMAQYRQNILDSLTNLKSQTPASVTAEDGTSLENVENITENMIFTVRY